MKWSRLAMLRCVLFHREKHVQTTVEHGGYFHHCSKCYPWAGMVLLILVLSVPSLAQQPQPLRIVSNCVKGVYDECQFVPPHWYYLKNGIWTRDDGLIGKPPVAVSKGCDDSNLRNAINGHDSQIEARLATPYLPKQNDSPWNLNAKLSAFAFAVTASLDCWSTGNLHENNPLLRNSHGGVNQAACGAINGTALGLTILLQKNHPKIANWFRWFGAGGHLGAFVHNQAVKR